jgi:hypothetical protein
MAQLPIRGLTLYKQGIGYFERRGTVDGSEVSLVIPRASTNDVLKSLDVVVHQGGPVLSVDYETPEDKARVLSNLPVKLADRSSLVDLLTSLRGSSITLQLSDTTTVTGRIVGVESSLDPIAHPPTVLLQQDADLRVVPLAHVHGLTLHDERAATDIGFFLDVSRTEQTRTTLTVRLAHATHDLGMSYTAPSPTWRVSYRLVGDGQKRARLLGWGLFDNCLDEDLENVTLTLMSGRPVSFEYGLYESRVPSRPHVSDDPTALENMSGNPLMAESLSAISHELRTPLTSIRGYAELLERDAVGALSEQQREMVRVMRQGAERMNALLSDLLDIVRLKDRGFELAPFLYRSGPLGDLKVSGSYFLPVMMGNAEPEFLIYQVSAPVSVRRGQSAMVPIIDATLEYQQLCVYNGAKMPNHPLLVWRLQNTTGVALEQGPVTVVESGRYLGEGVVRFTGVGDDLHIPYALEFGILVRQDIETQPRSLWRVDFDSQARRAQVRWYHITEHRYTLTSRVNRVIRVLIEHRDPSRGEYDAMPEPDLQMGGHTRWEVVVLANGEATFTVREREVHTISEEIASWKAEYIDTLRSDGKLAEPVHSLLRRLATATQQIAAANEQIAALQEEYKQILALQEQLRKNLSALGASEREVTIRNRVLDDLETSENRRRTIESTAVDLDQQIKQSQGDQQRLIDEIYSQAG